MRSEFGVMLADPGGRPAPYTNQDQVAPCSSHDLDPSMCFSDYQSSSIQLVTQDLLAQLQQQLHSRQSYQPRSQPQMQQYMPVQQSPAGTHSSIVCDIFRQPLTEISFQSVPPQLYLEYPRPPLPQVYFDHRMLHMPLCYKRSSMSSPIDTAPVSSPEQTHDITRVSPQIISQHTSQVVDSRPLLRRFQ